MSDRFAVPDRADHPDLSALAPSLVLAHATRFARVHVGRPTRLIVLEWFAYANATEYRQMLEDAPAPFHVRTRGPDTGAP